MTIQTTSTSNQIVQYSPRYNIFAQDGDACAKELDFCDDEFRDTFIKSDDDGFRVDYLSGDELFKTSLNSPRELYQVLQQRQQQQQQPRPRVQIFPLRISKESMCTMLRSLNIHVSFINILMAFGEKPRKSEAGLDYFFSNYYDYDTDNNPGSFEMMYLHRMVEKVCSNMNACDTTSDTANRWETTTRQIGVYHRHDHQNNQDTYLFLQPVDWDDSAFSVAIEDLRECVEAREELVSYPIKLHEVLFKTYFPNWRQYLKGKSEEFTERSDEIFGVAIDRAHGIMYTTLLDWRNLADIIMPVPEYLDSLMRILDGLQEVDGRLHAFDMSQQEQQRRHQQQQQVQYSSHQQQQQPLQPTTTAKNVPSPLSSFIRSHKSHLPSLHASTVNLSNRISNIISLLGGTTIDLKYQHSNHLLSRATHRLNQTMATLTQSTMEDSSSMRTITYLGLLYLPASFISSVFGMNFFNFDDIRKKIEIAGDFWIWVVLVVPLTFLSVVACRWIEGGEMKRREKRKKTGKQRSRWVVNDSHDGRENDLEDFDVDLEVEGKNWTTGGSAGVVVGRTDTGLTRVETGGPGAAAAAAAFRERAARDNNFHFVACSRGLDHSPALPPASPSSPPQQQKSQQYQQQQQQKLQNQQQQSQRWSVDSRGAVEPLDIATSTPTTTTTTGGTPPTITNGGAAANHHHHQQTNFRGPLTTPSQTQENV